MRTRMTSAAAAALLLTLYGCGGGGGGDDADADATDPAPPAVSNNGTVTAAAFAGTAYLKTQVTDKSGGVPVNMDRTIEVDLCNDVRQRYYQLPAVVPSEDLVAQTYAAYEELYLDTDKAATYDTFYTLTLPDYHRWMDAMKAATSALPEAPPDCSVAQLRTVTNGQVWREGIRYDIDFEHQRAGGVAVPAVWTPWQRQSQQETEAHTTQQVLGEKCYVYAETTAVASSESCLWDRFPNATYLNWVWTLRSHVTTNDGSEEIREAVELSRDRPIDRSKFEIPAGFQVKLPG